MEVEKRYSLGRHFFKEENAPLEFKMYHDIILAQGSIIIMNSKVSFFNACLAYIFLTDDEIIVKNINTHQQEILDIGPFWETYEDGFKEGVKYFDNNYKLPAIIIYGSAETYVNDLSNLYHDLPTLHFSSTGWDSVKRSVPSLLTHEIIRDYGYYSGLVYKTDELVSMYPEKFKLFHVCEQPPLKFDLPDVLHTDFTVKQLELIYSRLLNKKIVNRKDELAFLGIWSDENAGGVHYDEKIVGAKATLFSLMIRITGSELKAKDLKRYFITGEPIHDNWNGHTKSKLTKEILDNL